MIGKSIDSLSDTQKRQIAVAYMMMNPDVQEDGQKSLFTKLEGYDTQGSNLKGAIDQAKASIRELTPKFENVIGSISAISDVIADGLSAEQIEKYSTLFIQENPGIKTSVEPPKEIDMAGSTAKKLGPVDVDKN